MNNEVARRLWAALTSCRKAFGAETSTCQRLTRELLLRTNAPEVLARWPSKPARFATMAALLLASQAHPAAAVPVDAAPAPHSQRDALLLQYSNSPLAFERNAGQTDSRVDFLARGVNYQLFLEGPNATLKLMQRFSTSTDGAKLNRSDAVRVRWLGSRKKATPEGDRPLAGRAHYFRGDASKSVSNVETYERVRYRGLYPGVDLVYYASQGQLEYDVVVAAGADPSRIRFAVDGARRSSIDSDGNILLQTKAGDAKLNRPVVYQMRDGARQQVDARYERSRSGVYRIALGRYDPSGELVIDPVLTYGSYLGGTSTNEALSIAVDAAGSAYVAGFTASADFPIVSAYRSTITAQGSFDAFITKFRPDGSGLVYSTYLGGVPPRRSTSSQRVTGIAVDGAGSAFVTGTTNASSFPVTSGAYQAVAAAGGSFLTKLSPSGSALVYSTFLLDATASSIAIDDGGNAYVTGTATPAFQTSADAFQRAFRSTSGGTSAFIASLNATGTAIRYASFLGGSGSDSGKSVAVGADGSAYVGGSTTSYDFPTTAGAYRMSIAGRTDGFLTKVTPAGSGLVFSTFFGGSLDDHINGIAVDAAGAAYIVGETFSSDLPMRNAFQPVKAGRNMTNSSLGNAFVAKMFPAGDALVYGSFLGGEVCRLCYSVFGLEQFQADYGLAVAVDSAGHAYITGIAQSYQFPLVNSLISNQGTDTELQSSAFLAKIGLAGNSVLYNTLTTTDSGEKRVSVAVDSLGSAYGAATAATGQTGAINLVSPGSFMPTQGLNGGGYALVYKLAAPAPVLTLTSSANPVSAQVPFTLSVSVADAALSGSVTFLNGSDWIGTATLTGGGASLTTTLPPGVHRLTAVYRSSATATDSPLLYQVVNPALVCK